MRGPQVFSDASGARKWVLTGSVIILLLALFVLGSAFLFSFFDIPVNAPIAGLFGAKKENARNAGIPLPLRSVPVSPAALERYRKQALLALEHANPKEVKAGPEGASAKVVIGFYASWQTAGLSSLRAHAEKLTHLMPEWLQLNQKGDNVDQSENEPSAAAQKAEVRQIATGAGLEIWPILNNHDGKKFDPERVHRLLMQKPDGQRRFAETLRDWLLQEKCQGINLDLESLQDSDYARLAAFTPLLAGVLHAAHLSISLDLEVSQLKAKWLPAVVSACDLLIVMAYDEHGAGDTPGSVASLDWSTEALVEALKVVPRSKLILGIGGFGYDWTVGKSAAGSITYQQAILLARDYGPPEDPGRAIRFDADTLNPRLEYFDELGQDHKVWFLDGVTAFNQWALAKKADIRGAALWMLGSEDPSAWSVLDKKELFAPRKLHELQNINFPYEIEFEGQGEILSIAAAPRMGARKVAGDLPSGLVTGAEYTELPSCYVIKRRGYHPRKVAFTFDDGPSAEFTPEILDTLKELQISATFFVCGENAARFPALIQREWQEGHELGNHTFSHPNLATVGRERAIVEITSTKRALQSILGRSTVWFRAPYHADAEPATADEVNPLEIATQLGYAAVGELIDPRDWDLWTVNAAGQRVRRTPQEIAQAGLEQVGVVKGNTILLHDAGGDRSATSKALRIMVPELKRRGFEFVRISDLAGISREQAMPLLTTREQVINRINAIMFGTIFSILHFLGVAFVSAIGLGIARVIFVTTLAVISQARARSVAASADYHPLVSVIVPAYNECKVVARTIRSVLAGDYENIEILFVDDGSSDGTADVVDVEFTGDPRVRVIRQENGGKASALNHGIAQSSGEIIVGLDADTQFGAQTIASMVGHFTDARVGAVAGNVKVGNTVNILTRWQAVEYITSQNVDRLAYALLNAVTVVPGAVGAWRRAAIEEAGGYVTDTLAEDMDLTWRLRRKGWKIETENRAVAYTEAPAEVGQFLKQRFRWSYGTLQCLWKHRGALLRYGWFGWVGLPTMWLFQIVFQILAPVADLQLLYALCAFASGWLNQHLHPADDVPTADLYPMLIQTAAFYLVFYAVELTGAAVAIGIEGERWRLLRGLFIQRFSYRQLMYAVLWKSIVKAVAGTRAGWGKLERKGTVQIGARAEGLKG